MNSKIQELADAIATLYDEQRATLAIANILKRISENGTYRDVYEYIRQFNLGGIFKEILPADEYLENISEYKDLSDAFMTAVIRHQKDITSQIELVQTAMNEAAGEHIKPVKVPFEENRIKEIFNNTVLEDIDGALMKYYSELTDEALVSNAEIQRRLGYDVVIIRRYDERGLNHNFKVKAKNGKTYSYGNKYVKDCEFCKRLAEKPVNYDDINQNKDIFLRHLGCTCSIDYVNKGRTERVQNYRKNITTRS